MKRLVQYSQEWTACSVQIEKYDCFQSLPIYQEIEKFSEICYHTCDVIHTMLKKVCGGRLVTATRRVSTACCILLCRIMLVDLSTKKMISLLIG